ncbi:hypothetical protein J7413_15780 [Shimia sp. R10_1]|uniref:hypothetical protein n=1 Tax=Shimia sp. R10_1 TaxID=2821095 RepID=UPI001ADC5D9D|nr:hypothetical protein [Shimia sp. R10_1]MBO9475008.1 hypothetical protein [Shimia sp. R10_1]
MRHGFRLGEFDVDASQDLATGLRVGIPSQGKEDRRLMREAKRRMKTLSRREKPPVQLSNVERAMLRNAPDLVTPDIRAFADDTTADWRARWPRPRLLALIVIITLAAIVPSVAMRLLIWCVIMLLLTSVMLGPERARDAVQFAGQHIARVWGREIRFVQRLWSR